jgi:hypothetical protein
VTPFQGFIIIARLVPRAVPWAFMSQPCGLQPAALCGHTQFTPTRMTGIAGTLGFFLDNIYLPNYANVSVFGRYVGHQVLSGTGLAGPSQGPIS